MRSPTAAELHRVVEQRDGFLTVHAEAWVFKSVGQACFVGGFEKSGAQLAMDLDCCAQIWDVVAEREIVHLNVPH